MPRVFVTPFSLLALVVFLGGGASSAIAAGAGEIPGRGFLPDNRGWEKVTPEDKNGFGLSPVSTTSVAPSGDAVGWGLYGGPSPLTPAGVGEDALVSERDAAKGEWTYRSLIPPVPYEFEFAAVPRVPFISRDLSKAVVRSYSDLDPDQPATGSPNLFLGDNDHSYEAITTTGGGAGSILGTADLGQILFNSTLAQTSDPVSAFTSYPYEWSNGDVRLVSVLPGGVIPPEGAVVGTHSFLGYSSRDHAFSEDGRRIFFSPFDSTIRPNNTGQLYVREDPDGTGPEGPTTRHVSISERTDCANDPTCGGDNEPDPAPDPLGPLPPTLLAGEAAHGDKVLFSSCEKLTDDSTASSAGVGSENGVCNSNYTTEKNDIYLFDLNANGGAGELTDLTTADPAGARVMGIIGASDDLSRFYFAAKGVLAGNTGANGTTATDGLLNLYAWDSGNTTFIASLAEDTFNQNPPDDPDNWVPLTSIRDRLSRVSDNGRYLAFTARAHLTPYDNRNPKCKALPLENACSQVYRYDVVEDELDCLSCPADGGPPRGDAMLMFAPYQVFGFTETDDHYDQPYNLLDDGTVFFETPTKLVSDDSNGHIDVYQFRGGEIRLISDGATEADAHFFDASPSGSDVFFSTTARLTPDDSGEQEDLYDARVNGGFPGPPLPPPACEGDACQPPPVIPSDPTPSSSTFSGAGSPATRAKSKQRCPKGRRVKKGRCTAKRKPQNRAANTNRRGGK